MKLCACCTFELITEYIKSHQNEVPAAGVLVTRGSDSLGSEMSVWQHYSLFVYCHSLSPICNICSYLFVEPLGFTYPKLCWTTWNCHFLGQFSAALLRWMRGHGQEHRWEGSWHFSAFHLPRMIREHRLCLQRKSDCGPCRFVCSLVAGWTFNIIFSLASGKEVRTIKMAMTERVTSAAGGHM